MLVPSDAVHDLDFLKSKKIQVLQFCCVGDLLSWLVKIYFQIKVKVNAGIFIADGH